MLYVNKSDEAQQVLIPMNAEPVGGAMELTLVSTIDRRAWTFSVTSLAVNLTYYNIAVVIPDECPVGEYEYTLKKGYETLSGGILYVTEQRTITEYEKPIEYEQYIQD